MDWITRVSLFLRPELYLRENQLARLFFAVLRKLANDEDRKEFEDMLSEFALKDKSFFVRLTKSDIQLMIWLMDAAPNVFDDLNEKKYRTGTVYIHELREKIDPVIERHLSELWISNKHILKKTIEENQKFITLFRKKHGELVDFYEAA
jgi:flagellar biosynthesis/type III secretory pathway chaperone